MPGTQEARSKEACDWLTLGQLLNDNRERQASQVILVVKNPPANAGDLREAGAIFLSQEDPMEEGTTSHSSILAWRIPWTGEPGGLQSIRSQKSRTLKQLSTHVPTHATMKGKMKDVPKRPG